MGTWYRGEYIMSDVEKIKREKLQKLKDDLNEATGKELTKLINDYIETVFYFGYDLGYDEGYQDCSEENDIDSDIDERDPYGDGDTVEDEDLNFANGIGGIKL